MTLCIMEKWTNKESTKDSMNKNKTKYTKPVLIFYGKPCPAVNYRDVMEERRQYWYGVRFMSTALSLYAAVLVWWKWVEYCFMLHLNRWRYLYRIVLRIVSCSPLALYEIITAAISFVVCSVLLKLLRTQPGILDWSRCKVIKQFVKQAAYTMPPLFHWGTLYGYFKFVGGL